MEFLLYSYIYLGNVTDSWRRKGESKQRMEKYIVRSLHNVALNRKRPRSTSFLYEHRPHKGSCWTSPDTRLYFHMFLDKLILGWVLWESLHEEDTVGDLHSSGHHYNASVSCLVYHDRNGAGWFIDFSHLTLQQSYECIPVPDWDGC